MAVNIMVAEVVEVKSLMILEAVRKSNTIKNKTCEKSLTITALKHMIKLKVQKNTSNKEAEVILKEEEAEVISSTKNTTTTMNRKTKNLNTQKRRRVTITNKKKTNRKNHN